MVFLAQAQMLLSEIQNSLKLALPYLGKRCLKCYLGREQSFEKGFRVQFRIQPSVAYKSVAYKKKACKRFFFAMHHRSQHYTLYERLIQG